MDFCVVKCAVMVMRRKLTIVLKVVSWNEICCYLNDLRVSSYLILHLKVYILGHALVTLEVNLEYFKIFIVRLPEIRKCHNRPPSGGITNPLTHHICTTSFCG